MKKLFQASWQKGQATQKGIIATLSSGFLTVTLMPEDNGVTYLTYKKK